MKSLSIDLLRSFVTVVEVGNFTQAGELLGRSQPAVSLQLKRLEEAVGRQLLIRAGSRPDLTPAGEQLFDYARRILRLNDEALAQIGGAAITGTVRVGIPSEFATTLLPGIVGRFNQTYPGVTLEVTSRLSRYLLSEPGRKQFDLILALHDEPDEAGEHRVRTDELVWVSGAGSDSPGREPLPLVLAPDGCIYRKRVLARLAEAATPWRVVYTNADLTGIQAAMEAGLGVTALARSTVPPNLRVLRPGGRLPPLGQVTISLIACRGGEAVEHLADYVRASLG